MTGTNAEYDVFVSYASEDRDNVREYVRGLRRSGLRIWLDEERMPPGRDARDIIEHGLRQSHHVVAWVTEAWLDKKWTQWEVMFSQDKGRVVVPVLHVPWDHRRMGPYLSWQARIPNGLSLAEQIWLTLCGIRDTAPGDQVEWESRGRQAMGDTQTAEAPARSRLVDLSREPHRSLGACLALATDPRVPPSDATEELLALSKRVESMRGSLEMAPWLEVYDAAIAIVERIEHDTQWRQRALEKQLPSEATFEQIEQTDLSAPERDALDVRRRLMSELDGLRTRWVAEIRKQAAHQVGPELGAQGRRVLDVSIFQSPEEMRLRVARESQHQLRDGARRALEAWDRNVLGRMRRQRERMVDKTRLPLSKGVGADFEPVAFRGPSSSHLQEPPEDVVPLSSFVRRAASRRALFGLGLVALLTATTFGGAAIAGQWLVAGGMVAVGAGAALIWVPVAAEVERQRHIEEARTAFQRQIASWWSDTAGAIAQLRAQALSTWVQRTLEGWRGDLTTWWESTISENLQDAVQQASERAESVRQRAVEIRQEIRQLTEAAARLSEARRALSHHASALARGR